MKNIFLLLLILSITIIYADLPQQTVTLTCDENKTPLEDTTVQYFVSENNESDDGEFTWPAGATSVNIVVGTVGNNDDTEDVTANYIIDPVAYPNPSTGNGNIKINCNYRPEFDVELAEKVTLLNNSSLSYKLDNFSPEFIEAINIKGQTLYKEINGNKVNFYADSNKKSLANGTYFLKINASLDDQKFNQSTKGYSKKSEQPTRESRDLEVLLTVESGQAHTWSQEVEGTHINFSKTFITEPITTQYSNELTRFGLVEYNLITQKSETSDVAKTQIVPNGVPLKIEIDSQVMLTYCDAEGNPIDDFFTVRLKEEGQTSIDDFALNKHGNVTYLKQYQDINELGDTWNLYAIGGYWESNNGNITQPEDYVRFIRAGDMNNEAWSDGKLQQFIDVLNDKWNKVNPDMPEFEYFMTTNEDGDTTIGYTENHPEPVYCPDRDSTFVTPLPDTGNYTKYKFRTTGTAGSAMLIIHDNSNYVNFAAIALRYNAISGSGLQETLSDLVFGVTQVPYTIYNSYSAYTDEDSQLYWANQNHDGKRSEQCLIDADYFSETTASYEWGSGFNSTTEIEFQLEETDKFTEDN